MRRVEFSLAKSRQWRHVVEGLLLLGMAASLFAQAPPAPSDVPPDATPQIQQITPNQATAGTHITVAIQGSNFSAGAYVSSISPAVRVGSSKRISATQLEAQLSVSASAQPSTVSLLVSNPASRAAEAAFKIVAGQAAPVVPSPGAEPPTPAAPPTPTSPPASPAPPVPEANPTAPAAPPGPQVTTVSPPRVGPGFDLDLKISGKNFVPGTKVSFANTGIRVMGITAPSPTELTVHVKVAGDAAPGAGSLFVVNPDDSEVEVPFEVTAKGATQPASPSAPATPPAPAAGVVEAQRYAAYHLGSPAEIFEVHGKIKGALVVSAGTLRYEEDGKTLINITLNDIREIRTSSFATATFHITLNSGKTYHFAPGSLHPSDARDLVDALRKDLPH